MERALAQRQKREDSVGVHLGIQDVSHTINSFRKASHDKALGTYGQHTVVISLTN
jgi:hypothetical protein